LYWRGLVMSKLEEGAWQSLRYYEVPAAERRPRAVDTSGDPLSYSIIMAPTQQNWLYSLRYAQSSKPGVMSSSNYLLFSPAIIEDEYLYRVETWPDAVLEPSLTDWRRDTELQLPAGQNPQAAQLAGELRQGSVSDQAFVDAVLAHFTNEPFGYTLQPPLLPEADPVDAFLFQTRQGFCEHYAYAFVVMMRAAGVPARVVAGYQGGEINPVNKTVIVHQFDAHAWAEVWLPDKGWVRVDPTAAVSPDRIEWGLERAMASEGSFLSDLPLSPLRYRSIAWVNMLRLRYDALTWRWQSWVVGFNTESQFQLLQDVFGELSARKFAAVLLGTWGLFLLPVAISLLRKRDTHQLSVLDKYYLLFCERLAGVGVVRAPDETPAQFSARALRTLPVLAAKIEPIADSYQQLAYNDAAMSAEQRQQQLRQFQRQVSAFRP
jgi:transglutaminase-like putative cysteine protease